jgi:hypothetical protein
MSNEQQGTQHVQKGNSAAAQEVSGSPGFHDNVSQAPVYRHASWTQRHTALRLLLVLEPDRHTLYHTNSVATWNRRLTDRQGHWSHHIHNPAYCLLLSIATAKI